MSNGHNEVATPGGRVGSRVARLVADAVIMVRKELAGTQSMIGQQIFTETTNHVSDEVRSVMGQTFQRIADDPGLPLELKPLFTHLAQTRGQAFAWIGGAATGAAMSSGLGDLLNNSLAPVISSLIAGNPNAYLSAEQSAAIEARQLSRGWDNQQEAARRGVSGDRFRLLARLSQRDMATGEVFELYNRGSLDRDSAVAELVRGGVSRSSADKIIDLAKVPLTAEQAASAWARNLVSDGLVRMASRAQGLTNEDADILMGLAGEPPSLEALITAWRRGIITESDVDRGIVQGPIRNEWIPVVKSLQEQPLPPEEAASAVTQGHLTPEQGQAKARLSGITPEDFETIVANSGLPPGIEFMAEARNRGLVDEGEWERVFKESRIKNIYIDLMRKMRTRIIPQETLRLLYRHGLYDRAKAVQVLMGHGFSETDAGVLLDLEAIRGQDATRELTRAQILDLYSEDIIDRTTVEEMLRSIGFGEEETQWLVELEEVAKVRALVNAATTRVRSAYVAGLIDAEVATALLDQIGVSPTRRDRLFSLWDLEQQTVRATLTTSQIQQALRKNYITDAEAYQRLLGRGYAPEDANVLVRLAGGSEQAATEEE